MSDERFAGMREDLVVGRLRGYRQWVVPGRDPHLRSMGMSSLGWHKSSITAACARGEDHTAPDPDCAVRDHGHGCGIYGWYRPEDTEWRAAGAPWPAVRAYGAVESWGKVLMGTRGFRAQHARILGLYMPAFCPDFEHHAEWEVSYDGDSGPSVRRMEPGHMRYKDVLAWIERQYQVPVFHSLRELCEVFPPEDMSSLVPDLPPSAYTPRKKDRWSYQLDATLKHEQMLMMRNSPPPSVYSMWKGPVV